MWGKDIDRELNNGIIGYIIYTDESLREKEESEVWGKEGFSLGTCSACASQASRMRVACASQLYNYMLRFYLISRLLKLSTKEPLGPRNSLLKT